VATPGGQLWDVTINGIAAGDNDFYARPFNVIVDSGTGSSTIPRWAADHYFAGVNGSIYDDNYQAYTYPCETKLPDFVFGVGRLGFRGRVPGSYFEGGSVDGGQMCTTTQLYTSTDNTGMFGLSFIPALFVVLDWDVARVGFANKPLGM
jgi:hypothetical protein